MDLASALVINHEVRQAGSFSGIAGSKMLDYYSREGEFREVGGCERNATDADLELERRMSLATIGDLVDYGSRQGRYEGRNTDLPLVEGERSGVCFGQHGLLDPEEVKRELAESKSHLVTSVVSVRREDAERLGLATKDGFEKLLRKEWSRQVERWGVMEPRDVKWAAWFHTDNAKSVHVHVATWDRSGRFSEPGAIIPRSQVWASQEGLRREALKDSISELNAERSLLRDFISYRVRVDLGQERDEGRERSLEQQAARCGCNLIDFADAGLSQERREEIAASVTARMPEGAVRALSYARSDEAVRTAALAAVKELRTEDKALDAAFRRYEGIVRDVSEGIGLRNGTERVGGDYRNPAREYYKDAVFDLNRRAANSVLRSCGPIDLRELHRGEEMSRIREVCGASRDERAAEYGRRAVALVEEREGRPLSPEKGREVREHAERLLAIGAEREDRLADLECGRTDVDRDMRTDQTHAYGLLDLADGLAAIFSFGGHEMERGSYEGVFKGRKPERLQAERGFDRGDELSL